MKLYELHLILTPNLREEEVNNVSAEVSGFLTSQNFNISSTKTKLNERLPYPIKHLRQAHSLNMEIAHEAETVFPEDLEVKLRRNENILRYLVFSKTEQDLKKIKPMPVMDQLKRQERRTALLPKEEVVAAEPKKELEPADVERIDKKIEELLK